MSTRRLVSIIIVVIILAVAFWLFARPEKTPAEQGDIDTNTNSGLRSLFPFASKKTPPIEETQPVQTTATTNEPAKTEVAPREESEGPLTQVTNRLVAGLTVLAPSTIPLIVEHSATDFGPKKTTLSTLPTVRFVERGTGYVFELDAKGANEKKISGTTIIRTSEALFGNSGESVIIRYIKDDNASVATFLGKLTTAKGTAESGTLEGNFLPDNVYDVAITPDGKSMLYLMPIDDGTAGISTKIDGTAKKQLFTTPFTEWLIDYGKNFVGLTTKASAFSPGYAYKITSTGEFERIIGGILGLTTKLSPDGTMLLYSVSEKDSVYLHVLRLKDNADTDTGLQTLPEKCVWEASSTVAYCGAPNNLPSGTYPDDWYQGLFHFNDAIWRVNTVNGTTTKLFRGGNPALDVTRAALDTKEEFLFFVDKNAGALWSLDIAKASANSSSIN